MSEKNMNNVDYSSSIQKTLDSREVDKYKVKLSYRKTSLCKNKLKAHCCIKWILFCILYLEPSVSTQHKRMETDNIQIKVIGQATQRTEFIAKLL